MQELHPLVPTLRARDNAGVIAPPPLLFVAGVGLGVAIDYAIGNSLTLGSSPRWTLGIILLVAASVFLALALGLFHRAGTRPEPWQPTTMIVDSGVYGLTRNPMYLGMALAYAGLALLADSPAALLLLPVVLIVIDVGVIRREERYLETKFGPEYLRYKARVRRWL